MSRFLARADVRALAFAFLIGLHFIASAFAVEAVVGLLGLQELFVVFPIVVGLLWGQAILLGQFLVLGARRPLLRIGLAASWFALVIYLAQPFFRAVSPSMGGNPLPALLLVPLVFSALLAAGRRLGGVRIGFDPGPSPHHDRLRFSLRQMFCLTLLAAVALASVRLGRDTIEGEPQAIVLGLLPAAHVLVVLPGLSLWAALGGRHPVLRSELLTLFGLASIVAPLYIARVQPQTYWTLGWPIVTASLVVIVSLLMVRAVGWRCYAQGPGGTARP
ncbi:MAG TPA: hypothetical protein VND64_06410 [Pirellulales bacterium]|nr:hypothetical protein [Pirellulales bacterium]